MTCKQCLLRALMNCDFVPQNCDVACDRRRNHRRRMTRIRQLNADLKRLIRCSSSISTPVDVIKELIENSLDAGASRVCVTISDVDAFIVLDNGSGIAEENYDLLCKQYCTSKISDVDSLRRVRTRGFRGEALACIANLSKLRVVTRCLGAVESTLLTFSSLGECVGCTLVDDGRMHSSGTAVHVEQLFHTMPVRAQVLQEKARAYNREIEALLVEFGIVCPTVTFQLVNGDKIWLKGAVSNSVEAIETLFGQSVRRSLQMVAFDMAARSEEGEEHVTKVTLVVPTKDVSKPTVVMRSTNDRMWFSVNGRVCDLPPLGAAITRLCRQSYASLTTKRYPLALCSIECAVELCDYNVSANKRQILITHMDRVVECVQRRLAVALGLGGRVDAVQTLTVDDELTFERADYGTVRKENTPSNLSSTRSPAASQAASAKAQSSSVRQVKAEVAHDAVVPLVRAASNKRSSLADGRINLTQDTSTAIAADSVCMIGDDDDDVAHGNDDEELAESAATPAPTDASDRTAFLAAFNFRRSSETTTATHASGVKRARRDTPVTVVCLLDVCVYVCVSE
jgi:DNA mismatch repair protein MutL